MADKILDRLVEAVNSLRENNSGQPNTTNDALKNLYPSTRGRGSSTTTFVRQPTTQASSSGTRATFQPSKNYKGKKASFPKQKTTSKASSKPAVLKDVILLPSPSMEEVPRGTFRESLYTRNFAASAIEIEEDMSEQDLRSLFDEIFKDKLHGVSDPIKYEFTRAIGNKIISVNAKPGYFTGKVIKYLSKQGKSN